MMGLAGGGAMLRGPKGEKGDPGIQGPQGPVGPQGPAGGGGATEVDITGATGVTVFDITGFSESVRRVKISAQVQPASSAKLLMQLGSIEGLQTVYAGVTDYTNNSNSRGSANITSSADISSAAGTLPAGMNDIIIELIKISQTYWLIRISCSYYGVGVSYKYETLCRCVLQSALTKVRIFNSASAQMTVSNVHVSTE